MGGERPTIGVIGAKHGRWLAREVRRLETEGLCELVALCRAPGHKTFSDVYNVMHADGLPTTRVFECHNPMQLFERVHLDAVIVASRPDLHYDHAMYAAITGCQLYVEKPTVWNPALPVAQNRRMGNELFDTANNLIGGGTQLSSWFQPDDEGYCRIAPFCTPADVRTLTFEQGTGSQKSVDEMLPDLLPHGYGVLRTIAGPGVVGELRFERPTDTHGAPLPHKIEISGSYTRSGAQPVQFTLRLDTTAGNSRDLYLHTVINGVRVDRHAERNPYRVYLHPANERRKVHVKDALYLHLRHWVGALRGEEAMRSQELRDVHTMLCDTFEAYRERYPSTVNSTLSLPTSNMPSRAPQSSQPCA